MPVSWKLWRAELANPSPEDRRADRSTNPQEMSGYFRIEGARTKPVWPMAIWTEDGQEATIFQIGNKIMNTVENETEWHEFTEGAWLKSVAVTRDQWASALDTGRWFDGRPARHFTEEEKTNLAADIIPDTPSNEGGNNAGEELPLDQQIDAKMKVQIARHKALGKIDTAEKATTAAEIVESIRALGKLGNAKREADRAPHLAEAQKIQNIWLPILTPGSELVPVIVKEIASYADAEKARLQAIADEAARVERARLQAIADEAARVERDRLQAIADEAAKVESERLQKLADDAAAAKGETAEVVEVKAEAVVFEAETVDVVAEQVAAPKVSTQFGRAVSKAKVKKGRITDLDKFIAALKGQQDFKDWLAEKANRLARADLTLDGMESYRE